MILFATDLRIHDLNILNDTNTKKIVSNNEYFHLSNYDLFEVTDGEIKKESYDKFQKAKLIFEKKGICFSDLRTCHLSKENHYQMSQYIIDVLEQKKDLPKFKKDFKEPSDIFSLRNSSDESFKFEWPKELENTKTLIEDQKSFTEKTNFIYD